MINYSSPFYISWNSISEEIPNEQKQVINGILVLDQIPDKLYRVYIQDMVEIEFHEEITEENQYKVNYKNNSFIYFHPSKNGQTITINRYYGKGQVYYSSDFIFTKVDSEGNITQVLSDIVEAGESAIVNLESINDAIDNANAATINANNAANNANTIAAAFDEAEDIRVSNESDRQEAESIRQSSETSRIAAENNRVTTENNRVIAESGRVSAENLRESFEDTRQSNEINRQNEESTRQSNETTRQNNETIRQNNETARNFWEVYNPETSYVPHNKVSYLGSSYINIEACTGIAPTDESKWLLIAKKGEDGLGVGDMKKVDYDTNEDGVVNDSDKLGGNLPSYFQKSIYKQTTTPLSPILDDLWIDTSSVPYILKRFNGTQFIDVGGSGGSGNTKVLILENTVTLDSDASTVVIGIEEFDKSTDFIMVHQNSVYIKQNDTDGYSISSDGLTINKVTGEWESGTTIFFTVLKNIAIEAPEYNGEFILDDSITNDKLAENVKIGDLSESTTVDKTSVINVTNELNSKIDAQTEKLDSGIINTDSLSFGLNTINYSGEVNVFPEISFKGKHYVNLLGKDGDCENISKWTVIGSNIALYYTQKQFGTNSIQVTATGTTATVVRTVQPIPIDNTKYYMLSGYIKNINIAAGNSIGIYATKGSSATQALKFTAGGLPTTFTRFAVKLAPADFAGETSIYAYFQCNSGGVGLKYNIDGIMFNEITAEDYALSDTELLAKYPYIESYGALTNPYFENRRGNLVRNGNGEEGIGYWTVGASSTLSIEGDKFKLVAASATLAYQFIKVKKNTDYYISLNISGVGSFRVYKQDVATIITTTSNGTFNSGDNDIIVIALRNSSAGTGYFDSIMLVEGTTPPTEYISCDLQSFVIEGQFTDDDEVTLKDGKLSGQLWWKHMTLYGKDFPFAYTWDYTGAKNIQLSLSSLSGFPAWNGSYTLVKHDGKIIRRSSDYASGDVSMTNATEIIIAVLDTDTGWAEAIAPNADEVKAFMNGWKATANNGTRYTAWVSVVDGTTVPTAQTIDFVKANVAAGYEGYRLHYKLANPEPITDINTHVHGNVWGLGVGDNYVTVDSGIVLGEVANPVLNGANTDYFINDISISGTSLRNKTQDLISTYKNEIFDSNWVLIKGANSYGLESIKIPKASFDVNATYTVDYQILKTLHAQSFGNLTLSYGQDVFTAISAIGKALESKQKADSVLDTLVDLSIYEEGQLGNSTNDSVRWHTRASRYSGGSSGEAHVSVFIPFKVIKRVKPIVTITDLVIRVKTSTGSHSAVYPSINFYHAPTVIQSIDGIFFYFIIGAGTVADDAVNNGLAINFKWKADCTGRI